MYGFLIFVNPKPTKYEPIVTSNKDHKDSNKGSSKGCNIGMDTHNNMDGADDIGYSLLDPAKR